MAGNAASMLGTRFMGRGVSQRRRVRKEGIGMGDGDWNSDTDTDTEATRWSSQGCTDMVAMTRPTTLECAYALSYDGCQAQVMGWAGLEQSVGYVLNSNSSACTAETRYGWMRIGRNVKLSGFHVSRGHTLHASAEQWWLSDVGTITGLHHSSLADTSLCVTAPGADAYAWAHEWGT